jgi:predicted N-acetyltransferase YhbS
MPLTIVQPRIEQLAQRPDVLPTIAAWIYDEWWTNVEGSNVGSLSELLQAHLIPNQMPLTLVASLERCPVGTVTLLAHDVDTDQWPELSPWLAAVYVVPGYRQRGIGAALVNAIVAQATALGVGSPYLSTVGREEFYARLGWEVVDRREGKTVMSKPRGGSP